MHRRGLSEQQVFDMLAKRLPKDAGVKRPFSAVDNDLVSMESAAVEGTVATTLNFEPAFSSLIRQRPEANIADMNAD